VYNLEKQFGALQGNCLDFAEFKPRGLHKKCAVETWKLEPISAFARRQEENQENCV
jgi:hypothetical protein